MVQIAPHRLEILHYLAEHGPCSCVEIMRGTGLSRDQVYPFLYQGSFNCLIANRKRYPQREDFATHREYTEAYDAAHRAPGQYILGDQGRRVLAEQGG